MKKTNKRDQIILLTITILVGSLVGVTYMLFEFLVKDGTNWLWNDLLKSDVYRWRVIPIAIVMSLLYSFTIRYFKKKRVVPTDTELMDEITSVGESSFKDFVVIFIIGLLSLLAGASLGPEASLLALSICLAAIFSKKMKILGTPIAELLGLSAVTALLTAFFFSIIPLAIPLLLLRKQKRLTNQTALLPILASLSAWLTIYFLNGNAFGTVPVSGSFDIKNMLTAVIVAFVTVLFGFGIKKLIKVLSKHITNFDNKYSWYVTAILFGTVLGLIYLVGGQSVQFTGSEGVDLLYENKASYTVIALMGLVFMKMLATSWSLSTGYRGGLVFPSIYVGVALSFAISTALSMFGIIDAGATIGAISGMFVVMINPLIGGILVFSLFPSEFIPVVVGGLIGAIFGYNLLLKIFTKHRIEI